LKTEISPDKAHSLRELHRLCDWVITLDRNAGIEYFDSPRENKEIYDAYVIDCVPEREDLGCLQLITSTSNLEEVRNLLDGALDQMGLSHSRRNAEFLMGDLKALSGRLAIRLTGQRAPTSELIALALSHANCRRSREQNGCWVSLDSGLLIPVDDVLDLIPPLASKGAELEEIESSPSGRVRPDLIYVSMLPRKGLQFQFIEVKYRRHLRAARSPEILEGIRQQAESLRKRWDEWYSNESACSSFRAVRRAKLARMLRFYAEKANRHSLSKDSYQNIVAEIDRMIEKGGEYTFAVAEKADRGWVFCPEYTGVAPLEVSPADWDTRIFLFGSGLLPDSDFHGDVGDGHDREAIIGKLHDEEVENSTKPSITPGQLLHADISRSAGPAPKLDQGESQTDVANERSRVESQTQDSDSSKAGTDSEKGERSVCLGTDLLTGSEVRPPIPVIATSLSEHRHSAGAAISAVHSRTVPGDCAS
jgi:hypothetical protein